MNDTPDDAVSTEAQDAPYPSSEELQELPDHIRSYIHDLETRCDPAGDLRRLDAEKQKRRELEAEVERIEELEAENERLKKQRRADMRRLVAAHRLVASVWCDVTGALGRKAERAKHLLLRVIHDHFGSPKTAIELLYKEEEKDDWLNGEFMGALDRAEDGEDE